MSSSDADYVALEGRAQEKGMSRTPSWPAGALKRVSTLTRVQDGLKASAGTFNDSMPIIAVQLGEYLILAWTTALIGRRFGEVALAGTSLGFMTFNLGFSIQRSFILGLDTQAPQAYGAGRLADVGLACQRAGACALVFACLVGPSLWLLKDVLLAIGQPPDTVEYAMDYLHCLSLSLPVHAVFDSAARFFWAQHVLWPPLVSVVVGLLVQGVWISLLSGPLAYLGYVGAALAPVVAYAAMLATLLCVAVVGKPHRPETWPGFQLTRAICAGDGQFGSFLMLSVACAFGESSEWWWWEIVGLHVGTFGPRAAATHAIAYTLVPLLIMIPNSIGISMCNVVGRQLGAGDTKAAKQTATIALTFGTLIAIAYSGAIYVWGDRVASCFTDDEGVLSERLTIWPWAALFLVLDAGFGMLAGLNRALGIQAWSARCVWLCLWAVGTPIIFFFGTDLTNTWHVLPIIYAIFDVALLGCSACSDWGRLAVAVKAAPHSPSKQTTPSPLSAALLNGLGA